MPSARGTCKKIFTGVRRPGRANEPRVEEAQRRDLKELVALDRECFLSLAWPAHGWWQVVMQPGWRARVVRNDGAVVAASVLLSGRPVVVLASLGVDPGARRRGLGRALLEDALAQAALTGSLWVALEVDRDNPSAISLYRSTGFGLLRRFVEDGRQRLEMVHRLRRPSRHTVAVRGKRWRRIQARIVRP